MAWKICSVVLVFLKLRLDEKATKFDKNLPPVLTDTYFYSDLILDSVISPNHAKKL